MAEWLTHLLNTPKVPCWISVAIIYLENVVYYSCKKQNKILYLNKVNWIR